MSKKKGRIITVEGCPCEVVDENVEAGVYCADGRLAPIGGGVVLVVEPGGLLFVVSVARYAGAWVNTYVHQGRARVNIITQLRRRAREMRS